MKKLLLFFSLFSFQIFSAAQITVTDATFPVTGDTLRTATDFGPSGIEITSTGGPYDWDFSSLSVGTQTEVVFLDASEGEVFAEIPNATHVVIGDQFGGETYFRVTNEKVELLAANGNDPTGFGISSIFRFSPPILQRRAPMEFFNVNNTTSSLALGLAWDDLPPVLTDSLPLPITPDSIRIRIANSRLDLVDAYGTLAIPGGSYEVLREKRTTMTETIVEAKVPILGWTDVSGLLSQFEGIGKDTSTVYEFFSNTEKEVIASVSVDADNNPTSVTFKDNGVLASDKEIFNDLTINVSPNPTSGLTNFDFIGFKNGEHELNIFGLNGGTVFSRNIDVQNEHNELVDLSMLAPAPYFYLIKNNQGAIVFSGKLIKE